MSLKVTLRLEPEMFLPMAELLPPLAPPPAPSPMRGPRELYEFLLLLPALLPRRPFPLEVDAPISDAADPLARRRPPEVAGVRLLGPYFPRDTEPVTLPALAAGCCEPPLIKLRTLPVSPPASVPFSLIPAR